MGSAAAAVTGGHCTRSLGAGPVWEGRRWRRIPRSGRVSIEKRVIELGVPNAPPAVPRGWFRRARRVCGAALALTGCVGLLPQPAPSADLSTIRLPSGFAIEFFARDLGYPRFMALDPRGTLLVSVPRAGRVIALPDDNRDGRADTVVPVVEGLELPHGLAFLDGQLYVAETGRVLRFDYDPATRRVAGAPMVIVPDLPARASHWTRTIAIGPDRRIYVSVGSSCNSCEERDRRRAAIYRYRADGEQPRRLRRGWQRSRTAFRPKAAELWTTVNGRDWLGMTAPPSMSRGSARAASTAGRTATGRWRGPCLTRTSVGRPLQGGAHGRTSSTRRTRLRSGSPSTRAPCFLREYRGDLFVALHGSWNRSAPVGYKVIRVRLEEPRRSRRTSRRAGSRTAATGPAVDLAVAPDGSLFLSDDNLGAVYRITYRGN